MFLLPLFVVILMPQIHAKVIETRMEAPDAKTVRLEAKGFVFLPGQYVSMKLNAGVHSFSISVSPGKGFIEITTKLSGSAFKQEFSKLKKGDLVKIFGPVGSFVLDEKEKKQCFLVGGIGITPFRSMLQQIAGKKLAVDVIVVYSNKTPEDIAFRAEFEKMEKENKNIRFLHTITRPEESETPWQGLTGHLNAEMVQKSIPDWKQRSYFVCGPPGFVDAVERMVIEMGVESEKVRAERFTGY